MGACLIEFRQKLTHCLPACIRTRLKSVSHFKFWFLVIFLIFLTIFLILSIFILGFQTNSNNNLPHYLAFDKYYHDIIQKSIKSSNKWEFLTFESRKKLFSSNKRFSFKKQYFKTNFSSKCIQRNKYLFEFLRLFGIDPLHDDLTKPHIFILGANTAIGNSLINAYNERNQSILYVNSPFWIDFMDQTFQKVMNYVNIEQIILCTSIPSYSHSQNQEKAKKHVHKQEIKFANSLMNWTKINSIPLFFISLPNNENMKNILSEKGAYIIEIPYFVDYEMYYDENNVLVHQISKMLARNEPLIDNEFDISNISSFTSKDLSQLILDKIEKKNLYTKIETSNVVTEEQLETIKENVKIHFDKMRNIKRNPYLSIVIVGRNDNFSKGFEKRAQNFLSVIENYTYEVPLADFEIVFVDYATPIEEKPLSEVMKIENPLFREKVHFIKVPLKTHHMLTQKLNQTLSFYEYIAKNIGVRRANGTFILTTNPDDILPIDFFEMISRKDFTDGLLYRSMRWSCKEDTEEHMTVNDIEELLKSPWDVKHQDLSMRCPTNIKKTVWFTDIQTLEKEAWSAGAGDFLMLSKDMWDVIHGFNEYPGNANVDALFLGKLMSFVPGYVRTFIRSPIIHQYHPRRNIYRPAVQHHEQLMRKYACSASCPSLNVYEDNPDWGLINELFL